METDENQKKASKTNRVGNYLFLKGTGSEYISNDEQLEAAVGGVAL